MRGRRGWLAPSHTSIRIQVPRSRSSFISVIWSCRRLEACLCPARSSGVGADTRSAAAPTRAYMRSNFQRDATSWPGIPRSSACTGALLPSVFAICGLPSERDDGATRAWLGVRACLRRGLELRGRIASSFAGARSALGPRCLHHGGALDRRFSATAAWIKGLNASASSTSPSRMSMARRVFPSRLELKSP
jgi:hypothetical protein